MTESLFARALLFEACFQSFFCFSNVHGSSKRAFYDLDMTWNALLPLTWPLSSFLVFLHVYFFFCLLVDSSIAVLFLPVVQLMGGGVAGVPVCSCVVTDISCL